MAKRKAEKKRAAVAKTNTSKAPAKQVMAVPELLLKILSGVLAVIMVIALTLYVLGKMPARGFWILTVILAVIAFVVIPAMRKKFLGQV